MALFLIAKLRDYDLSSGNTVLFFLFCVPFYSRMSKFFWINFPESFFRIYSGYARAQSLSSLQGEINARREELEVLDASVEKVQGQLAGYGDKVLGILSRAEVETKARVEGVYSDTIGNILDAGEVTGKRIDEISAKQLEAIDNAGKVGIGNLIAVHVEAKRMIDETSSLIRDDVMSTIRSEFEPYHGAFRVIPMMQPFVEYGFHMMRVPMDKTAAYKVPHVFVATMASSLDAWVREMLPEADTTMAVPGSLYNLVMNTPGQYRISVLSKWLRDELALKTWA
jgi:hypothetical protein